MLQSCSTVLLQSKMFYVPFLICKTPNQLTITASNSSHNNTSHDNSENPINEESDCEDSEFESSTFS